MCSCFPSFVSLSAEFKRSSKAATLGFQSRADVAAVFEEVYQQIIDAERQAHLAANDAASFKDSKAAKTPKSRRHKSSKKHSTSDSPPSATEDAPQRKRSADSKRAPSSKPSKASAPPKAPRAPPMTPLQYVWSMLTYTGVLVTMLAAVATAGGQYIRTVRAKQQRLAKAKKDLYLRPATGAGAGTGGTSTARRSAMANKSYLAMPLTQLISKIEVEEQFAVRSYSQLVLENIQLFCTEVFICSRNALTAVYEAIARRVEQVQQSPWVTQLLDYAEGKNTKFPVSLPMMPGTEEEVDAEDVISSLLVELEAEMAAAAKPAAGAAASGKATAARKNKHGSKARRGNKPKAKCPTASGEVEDRSATAAPMDGEGGTAEVTTRDAEPFADPEKESTGALKAGEETDQQGEQGGCQRQESEDSTEAALNISSDSGYRLDQEQEQEHEHHYSDSQGGFANAAEDDGDVDPILLEELMASMQGYAEAVAAASHARTADEGEWISTSGRRNNRGTAGQNNTAKQLHRQQLLRKTAEALFVSNKASANRSDAWRNAKWDKIKTAAMKRFISGVPNPLTVSPDTVAASAAMHNSKPATGSNAGDVSRTAPASAHQFHHPMPRRLSAAAVANMHHSGIAAAPAAATAAATAPRDRRVQTVASEDSLRAHYPHQSRVSDEGEQSSLTDSDTSEPAHHSSMPSMSGTFHSMHPPVGAAGQVPMMPNPMESNSVFQYCSMLQHYYQQQCNMMSSMGWTYVLSSPMPVASPAPEYSAAMYTPVAVPTGSMGPIMRMSPQPQSMHVPVISAAQNAAFPPLPSGRMQRSRSVSAEYFQPIQQGPALPRPGVVTGQYSYGVTNNSTPTVSPYYTGESPHGGGGNRFTPSPGISLATAMLAVGPTGSTGAGGGGTSIAPIHRPRVEEEALVAALQKQM